MKIVLLKNEQIVFPNGTHVLGKTGYFFTPEELNEYTANVVKQSLETAAENVDHLWDNNENELFDIDKESITNTFEEAYLKHKV